MSHDNLKTTNMTKLKHEQNKQYKDTNIKPGSRLEGHMRLNMHHTYYSAGTAWQLVQETATLSRQSTAGMILYGTARVTSALLSMKDGFSESTARALLPSPALFCFPPLSCNMTLLPCIVCVPSTQQLGTGFHAASTQHTCCFDMQCCPTHIMLQQYVQV